MEEDDDEESGDVLSFGGEVDNGERSGCVDCPP